MHVYIKGFVRKCSRKMNKGIQAYVEKYSIMIAKLILLLSVASVMRKLLKTTHPEECSVHKNSESCNIQLGSEKINLLLNKSFNITNYNLRFTSTHS